MRGEYEPYGYGKAALKGAYGFGYGSLICIAAAPGCCINPGLAAMPVLTPMFTLAAEGTNSGASVLITDASLTFPPGEGGILSLGTALENSLCCFLPLGLADGPYPLVVAGVLQVVSRLLVVRLIYNRHELLSRNFIQNIDFAEV